ncbi:MAG: GGDEF domain-containing protein [Anaeroplasmataceae bacterium]
MEVSNEKWRKKIYSYSLIFIVITLILEILSFIMYIIGDYMEDTIGIYVTENIIIPLAFNVGTYVACRIIDTKNYSDNFKNKACVIALIIPAMVIVIAHSHYPQVIMALSLVLAISSMFGDKKLLKMVLFMGLVVIIAASVLEFIEASTKEVIIDLIIGYLISLALFICTYLSCSIVLKNNCDKLDKISEYQKSELEFIELLKYDSLTGLYNNHAIKTTLEYGMKKNENIFFSMIDIDDFKKVNDTYGHLFGDEVLTNLSNILKKIQTTDIFAGRYGGEEFSIIFINKSKEEVKTILSTILSIFKENFKEYDISFSCGVAMSREYDKATDIIARADSELYKVKENGKSNIKFEE